MMNDSYAWYMSGAQALEECKEVVQQCNQVFVYGTLRQGKGNHYLLTGAETVSMNATTNKHYLMTSRGIPYVIEDLPTHPNLDRDRLRRLYADIKSKIQGEVYKVDHEIMFTLDNLEGHPHHYCRKIIDTSAGKAWIYFEADPKLTTVITRNVIKNGDYINPKI